MFSSAWQEFIKNLNGSKNPNRRSHNWPCLHSEVTCVQCYRCVFRLQGICNTTNDHWAKTEEGLSWGALSRLHMMNTWWCAVCRILFSKLFSGMSHYTYFFMNVGDYTCSVYGLTETLFKWSAEHWFETSHTFIWTFEIVELAHVPKPDHFCVVSPSLPTFNTSMLWFRGT